MVSSVRRSHFEEVSENPMLCDSAVLSMNGVFGNNSLSIADGEDSIVSSTVCRCSQTECLNLGVRAENYKQVGIRKVDSLLA